MSRWAAAVALLTHYFQVFISFLGRPALPPDG